MRLGQARRRYPLIFAPPPFVPPHPQALRTPVRNGPRRDYASPPKGRAGYVSALQPFLLPMPQPLRIPARNGPRRDYTSPLHGRAWYVGLQALPPTPPPAIFRRTPEGFRAGARQHQ
jgi:hypothetical protein